MTHVVVVGVTQGNAGTRARASNEQSPSDQGVTQRRRTCCTHSSMLLLRPVASRYCYCVSQFNRTEKKELVSCRPPCPPKYTLTMQSIVSTSTPRVGVGSEVRITSTISNRISQPSDTIRYLDKSAVVCRHTLHCMSGLHQMIPCCAQGALENSGQQRSTTIPRSSPR